MMHNLSLLYSQHKNKSVMNTGLYGVIFSTLLEKEVSGLVLMIVSATINS